MSILIGLIDLFKRRQKEQGIELPGPSFNAVLEGICCDNIRGSHLKLAKLEILENCTVIDDGEREYALRIRTDYSGKRLEMVGTLVEKRIRTKSLSWCPGVILPGGSIFQVLDMIRVVCLRDGRIFVYSDSPEEYLKYVQQLAEIIGRITLFEKPEYQQLYEKYTQR